jgi:UDP-2,4-diacetamido-2,4,6-trideoxy-beta-L-altropyranose hydrolase
MPVGTLLFRADASQAMGHGHVMRCLALAQAWQDRGGDCMFAMAEPIPVLEARLRSENIPVTPISARHGSADDATQLAELARKNNARWIVVDGYQFGIDYQRALTDAGHKLLAIDDYGHVGNHVADIVLDQNAGTAENFYLNRAPYTKLLLGTRYAMLRREFKPWRNWKREIPLIARKILITAGGSDPANLALRAIQALDFLHADGIEATVVVGSHNPHVQGLKNLGEKAQCRVRMAIDPSNMPELMASADVAISSAGSTCWEMCMMGLPAIIVDVAENQRPIAQELNARGISLRISLPQANPGNIASNLDSLLVSLKRRQQMSSEGREIIDGRGAERAIAAMLVREFTLRHANSGDLRLLWDWANDPSVRQASFSPNTIPWHDHEDWFAKKISDPSCFLMMFEDTNVPVATVRTQAGSRHDTEISITIAPAYRGHGLASALLERSLETIFKSSPAERVHAFIKPENNASSKSFENAGFVFLGNSRVKDCDALHYVCERQLQSSSEGRERARSREVVPC